MYVAVSAVHIDSMACPDVQIMNELSTKTSGGQPANYVAVACLLAKSGATVHKEKLQTIDCPPQTADTIASYARATK